MTLTYEEFAKDPMRYLQIAEEEEILLTKRNAVYLHLVNPNAEKLKAARSLQGSISDDLDVSDIIKCKPIDALPVTKEEYAILDLAVQEILERGSTTQRCPRCGKELVYILQGSRETIRCSDPACIKSTRRGI